jgi:1-acyl-sn-glycerol-3-phosphate acyltransferase
VLIGLGTRQRITYYFRIWSQRLLEIIELDYQVYNPYQLKFEADKNYIVMCNHTSLYDIPLSAIAIEGNMRMVAKKELFYVPVFGYAMKSLFSLIVKIVNKR